MEKDGITPKSELKEILKHPVMQSDIVDLGTIQFGHKVDEIGIVENYYMWELEKEVENCFYEIIIRKDFSCSRCDNRFLFY